jgi:hypothetical protein
MTGPKPYRSDEDYVPADAPGEPNDPLQWRHVMPAQTSGFDCWRWKK